VVIRWLRVLDLAIVFRSTLQGGNQWLRCIRCARQAIDASQFGACDVYWMSKCRTKDKRLCANVGTVEPLDTTTASVQSWTPVQISTPMVVSAAK